MQQIERSDLQFVFPEELIATEPRRPSRVLWNDHAGPKEISFAECLEQFQSGDVLVINDTRVLPMRVFSEQGLEVLFIERLSDKLWKVLFPASRLKGEAALRLPGGIHAVLEKRGLPQVVSLNEDISQDYFLTHGEPALPPYIQKARGERHARSEDMMWYQTAWAQHSGSQAAPTASLHFSRKHLSDLKRRGVQIVPVTLHVGLGTFMPIRHDNLDQHEMHFEWAHIPETSLEALEQSKREGRRIWGLGTTVVRTLESYGQGLLKPVNDGVAGKTNLFIRPPYDFTWVDILMTNFHQPETTLLALVMAFAGRDQVKTSYHYAIENKFKLFSYGDLSVWIGAR